MLYFFGARWPRDRVCDGWRIFLGAAPPLLCISCSKRLEPSDSGVVMPATGAGGEAYSCAYHRDCLLEDLGLTEGDASRPRGPEA